MLFILAPVNDHALFFPHLGYAHISAEFGALEEAQLAFGSGYYPSVYICTVLVQEDHELTIVQTPNLYPGGCWGEMRSLRITVKPKHIPGLMALLNACID